MRRYDTTFIVNSQIGDDGIDASVKEIANLITSTSGSILRENRIGNRRLAYEITRQTHGYYVSLIHESENETLTRLDRHFKLGGNYLRHLTIRFDGDPFRKTITEVMMGFESEKRVREESSNGDSPASKPESSPARPVATTASKVPAANTGGASVAQAVPVVPAAPIETVAPIETAAPVAPVAPVAPAESSASDTDEDSTL